MAKPVDSLRANVGQTWRTAANPVRAPQFTTFTGIGSGFINGIAAGSEGGIFCTTAEDDAGVEFYHLATQTGLLQDILVPSWSRKKDNVALRAG